MRFKSSQVLFNNTNVPLNGTLMVTEIVPEGWELVEVDCESEGQIIFSLIENGFSVDQCIGGDVTCNFNNVLVVRPIPALSQWSLIAAAAVLGIAGIVFYSRRRATA